jgi:hypothetical protein
VRFEQYKLIHAYDNPTASYYVPYEVLAGDDNLESTSCSQDEAIRTGAYVKMLFDVVNDPTETTNLYESTDPQIMEIKKQLYAYMDQLKTTAAEDVNPGKGVDAAEASWVTNKNYIGPWSIPEQVEGGKSFPLKCDEVESVFLNRK